MGRRRRRGQIALLNDNYNSDMVPQANPSSDGGLLKEEVKNNQEKENKEEMQHRHSRGRLSRRSPLNNNKEKAKAIVKVEEEWQDETTQICCRGRGRMQRRHAPGRDNGAATNRTIKQRPKEKVSVVDPVIQLQGQDETWAAVDPMEQLPQEEASVTERVEQSRGQEVVATTVDLVKQQQEEYMAEHTSAVPIGNHVTISRKGKKKRRHYACFEYNDLTFELEDSVLITPEESSHKPYAAIIKDIIEAEGNLTVTGQWFYRPEDAEIGEGKFCVAHDTWELFYSFHVDDVPAESVMHKCVVHFIPHNKQIPARKGHPGFICQKVYGVVEKKLQNLIDKGYADQGQEQIDNLIKKTVDRIGVLPDVEPGRRPDDSTYQFSKKRSVHNMDMNPIGVTRESQARKSENCEKSETPRSDKLRNYAILARYKTITGNQVRDKWLDNLLESIPLGWSKEIVARVQGADAIASTKSSSISSSKVVVYEDNKKYGLHDVIPIIVSLERSTHEALGEDFGKYNQKMRELWYNIKNSSVLRTRLMNKELDPPALLTMSPDELKSGLISAEKASEPEEPRRLQMTDERCQRCQEKKVGVSDIVRAGHRDRYQMECISCGHTWFSSYYSIIPSRTADVRSTAAATGNAATGTSTATAAWAAASEKQQQQAKSSSRVHSGTKRKNSRGSSFRNKEEEQQVRSNP